MSPQAHSPDGAKFFLLLAFQPPISLLMLSGPAPIARPVEELGQVHMTLLVLGVERDDAFEIGEGEIKLAEFQRQVGAGGQGEDGGRVEGDGLIQQFPGSIEVIPFDGATSEAGKRLRTIGAELAAPFQLGRGLVHVGIVQEAVGQEQSRLIVVGLAREDRSEFGHGLQGSTGLDKRP